ncbi:hypothetical protein BD324DRAFT_393615 [Kockovaella imperatae]|uniref:Uncharacterized protein n=1 Tax=Kockovaella imperatae TaxID=4999 RepID=A0A1Y1UI40_9TREE|nr:hypothetical protein BD324DRAFT_393615 [Kockovaella imperatae]ORX37721.1 hypothetical protein BD324DRAFT_393615 [Kockovaella imperatae]
MVVFSKPTTVAESSPDMSTVFKTSPNGHVVKDLISVYRNRAKVHLQETMPNKITHLQAMIALESNPESALWPGHVEHFEPKQAQPDHEAKHQMVMPDDVVSSKHSSIDSLGDDVLDDDPRNGVRVGPHWFEVVPQNDVQKRLIALSLKYGIEHLQILTSSESTKTCI